MDPSIPPQLMLAEYRGTNYFAASQDFFNVVDFSRRFNVFLIKLCRDLCNLMTIVLVSRCPFHGPDRK